jgi:uncharacterized membrane protein
MLGNVQTLSRVNALSDGIFSITLTLLVINLPAPELATSTDQALRDSLLELLPRIEVWAASFLVSAYLWSLHRRLLGCHHGADSPTIWGHLFFLAGVSLLPFSVNVLGSHPNLQTSYCLFYSHLGIIGAVLLLLLMKQLSLDDALVHKDFHQESHRRLALLHLASIPTVSVLCMLATFLHNRLALWGWLLSIFFALVSSRNQRRGVLNQASEPAPVSSG